MHRLKLESCKKITIINNITILNGDNCRIGDDIIRTDTVGDNCRIGDDVVDTSQIDKNDTDTDVKSTTDESNTSTHNYYALGCFVGYCILLATRILAN
jgi:acetyltransferase-like isoleucine patch superfamily enzyme